MKRQIIPLEKVVKCHVNSLDDGTLFSGSGTSTLFSFGYASGTSTFAELTNNQLNNDRTITLYYDVYKKIKAE